MSDTDFHRRVWKYRLSSALTTLSLPAGSKVLHVGMDPDPQQRSGVALWVDIQHDNQKENRYFVWVGTGDPHPLLDSAKYVGTVNDTGLMWHVWEIPAVVATRFLTGG